MNKTQLRNGSAIAATFLLMLAIGCGGGGSTSTTGGTAPTTGSITSGATTGTTSSTAGSAGGTTGSSAGTTGSTSGSSTGTTSGSAPTITNVGTYTFLQVPQWPDSSSPHALDATLTADQKIGFQVIKIPVYWDWATAQTNGITLNSDALSAYSGAVSAIARFGMRPFVVALTQNSIAPSSTTYGNGFPTSTADMNLFAAYLANLANALAPLSPSGLIIQIGVEPNLGTSDPTAPANYSTLFNLCKSKMPANVKLAGPGITSFVNNPPYVDAVTFATAFSKACSPDIFTADLYNGVNPPSQLMAVGQQLAALANGRPFWVECGYPSGPAGNPNQVGQTSQATYDLYEVQNFPSFASMVIVYMDEDESFVQSDPNNPQEGYFGVKTGADISTLKPSGQAIMNYLHGQTPALNQRKSLGTKPVRSH